MPPADNRSNPTLTERDIDPRSAGCAVSIRECQADIPGRVMRTRRLPAQSSEVACAQLHSTHRSRMIGIALGPHCRSWCSSFVGLIPDWDRRANTPDRASDPHHGAPTSTYDQGVGEDDAFGHTSVFGVRREDLILPNGQSKELSASWCWK